MCDRGMIEGNPKLMKLEGLIAISEEIQEKIIKGISELIGSPVYFLHPKQGEYPSDRPEYLKNTVVIHTDISSEANYSNHVVEFSLEQLPGCCGILVSYHVIVSPKYRGKGINTFLQKIREEIALNNGYTMLMCTTREDNAQEIHILEKNGWQNVNTFSNKRTGNIVRIYLKNIRKEG